MFGYRVVFCFVLKEAHSVRGAFGDHTHDKDKVCLEMEKFISGEKGIGKISHFIM